MSKRRDRRYWRSLEERNAPEGALPGTPEFEAPAPDRPFTVDRRRFLAMTGFALLAAGCAKREGRKALSSVLGPDGVPPGRILHYASTCQGCPASCGLLVRSRDGRPVKLEGNPVHALSRGGLCAVGQASLLGLYDRRRLRQPLAAGAKATWAAVDAAVAARLADIKAKGGGLRVLTRTTTSPTLRAQIASFLAPYADARLVTYDALPVSAVLDAHARTHGVRALPHLRFDRADVIVGIDADFLGTWISPVEFTAAYAAGRTLEGTPPRCSWHAQIESRLTVTGAKADRRIVAASWESGAIVSQLADRIATKAGVSWRRGELDACAVPAAALDEVASRLWSARGRALVACGVQDAGVQVVVNFINHVLGSYGATLDLDRPSLQAQGSDADVAALAKEMGEDRVAALFILEGNPAYELPFDWASLVKHVPLTVACAERLDETAALASHVCPRPHALAAWGDAEPVAGRFSIAQPVFPVLGEARPIVESLAAWSGSPAKALALVKEHWRTALHPKAGGAVPFQAFWDGAVHDGFVEIATGAKAPAVFNASAVAPAARGPEPEAGAFALVLHPSMALLDGSHAYNPWLQELPDPITKVAWDNGVSVAPAAAAALGVVDGDIVRLQDGALSLELPVIVQPGQHERTIAVALGYGSTLSERFAKVGPAWLEAKPTLGDHGQVGRNAAPWLSFREGTLRFVRTSVQVVKTGRRSPLAQSQTYASTSVPVGLAPRGQERRPVIQESVVASLAAPRPKPEARPDLWPEDHKHAGPRWGMVVDLSACTGCSACVVACQVENNIPVVGKDEVRRQRDLQWMRIDRYYADVEGGVDVAFQPMMCHHCANAPCETVCPVLATVSSAEGLNQQVYNRCVGTRYCANNCPYKVRRFNWFDYAREDALENLALNPDVTVRSRGVMEKCSLCVQRIQEAKLEAKRRGVPMADGAASTACQQSCPAGAIVFGDLNDPASAAARKAASGRAYQVLAELNVKPGVSYLDVVRNRPAGEATRHD